MSDNIGKFPSDFVSNAVKDSPSFGKQIADIIDSEWFASGRLTQRRRWIDKMRRYGKGEQNTNYKKIIEGKRNTNGLDIKTHKIEYGKEQQLKVIQVFRDILTNAIDESLFKPRAESIDVTSVNKKKDYFKKLSKQFYNRELDEKVGEVIGVNLRPQDPPESLEQLQQRKLEYKPDIEIAQELAVENVLKLEKFETIKDKVDEDLVDLGVGVCRHYTDKTEGIKIKYVDPYNWLHNSFEYDDGRDIRYNAVMMTGTIGDVIKEAKGITEKDLLKIKNYSIGNLSNTEPYTNADDSHRLIEYMVFAYKLPMSRVFKKRHKYKRVKLIDRTLNNEHNLADNKKLEIPEVVWYEGVYIPTTGVLLKWERIPNQVENGVNNPISPFIVYAPKVKRLSEGGSIRFYSLIQRAIPILDDLQVDWYKFQQLKRELRPNTTVINPDMLNQVELGGTKLSPQTILDLFFGRGILLARETDEDGERLGRAIIEQTGGINNTALGFLSQEFTNNYNRLRQLLGINELRDGTTKPNSRTAVTVQKLLLASSNNATNHIVKGSFQISLQICNAISLRLYDVLTTKVLKDRYMNVIGSDNVELLDAIKEMPMHKFAIYFDFRPDNNERIAFEQSLITALSEKSINVAQYNKARQIRNVKSAIKFLDIAIKDNEIRQEQSKLKFIQEQAKANAQTSVLAEQTKQQTATIKWDIERQKMLVKAEIDDNMAKKEALIKDLLAEREHKRKKELLIIETGGLLERENKREDRKDNRVDKQSTNQSKLIDQRKNNTEPINFEKNITDIFQSNKLPTIQKS